MSRPAAVRSIPRRYQLNKEGYGVLVGGHPWIFRSHLSSAAGVFADGQWLALYDGKNRVVGHGLYEAEGAIGIRVLARGAERPRGATFLARIDAALARRAVLRASTDGVRVVHGESDGVPAVVVEVFGPVVVAQSYALGADGLARLAARRVAAALGATTIIAKPAHRRIAGPGAPRRLRGAAPSSVTFTEDGLRFAVDPLGGQKSGTYLDLRGLRRWVRAQPLAGASVLNLFAYTGMLGVCAEAAGAARVTHVDASGVALAWAASHHAPTASRHVHTEADVFDWLPLQPAEGAHALVIVDPPSMTSRVEQVPRVLAAYKRLYGLARGQVAPGGALVAACCTSRVTREALRRTVADALGPEFSLEAELPTEVDHPVGFPQADYLKVLVFRRAS